MLYSLFAKVAYADTADLDTFLGKVMDHVVNPAIKLMFGIALVIFLYGMFEFVAGAENEEKRAKGKVHMMWGVIGMFIMVSAVGIINLITGTLGIT